MWTILFRLHINIIEKLISHISPLNTPMCSNDYNEAYKTGHNVCLFFNLFLNDVSLSSGLSVKLHSGGCQLSRVSIGSGNGLVASGNKSLPDPTLTQIYVIIGIRDHLFEEIYSTCNWQKDAFSLFVHIDVGCWKNQSVYKRPTSINIGIKRTSAMP